ncbi:hypothetical protein U9M48_008766 [Paspalum notatum var. saurae]|uniref:Uncharacterized protein n=1 Tax=Paspalum notatum var. saurae TaxID=547442 RepID=A0AAQ3SQT6_PASNO
MKALKRHFSKAAEKVIHDSLYNAMVTAVCHYYKSVKGENMTKKKEANTIYLKEEEYLKTESEGKRINRGQDPGHKYEADGYFGLQRRMEAESGTQQSFLNVFLRGHRGPDPNNTDVLCSQAAKDKLDRYGKEMVKHHGEGVQWMQQPIDVDALYQSGEGRRHGRVEYAQEEAHEARQAREEARQTREYSQQAFAYKSPFMKPPQAWTQPQGPPAWTQPQGPQGSGGWPAWPPTKGSQMGPQGS